jgi:CHAD domain-containing protein
MSYRIHLHESLADGVPRIVCEQMDRAVAELTAPDPDVTEVVHRARKRCKKIRGLLRLVRGSFSASYPQENAWFRDLARSLSGVRDADVMLKCVEKLPASFGRELEPDAFLSVRQAFEQRREALRNDASLPERLAGVARRLQGARLRVLGWRLDDAGISAIEPGLVRTYRRARKALRAGYEEPTPERFHEWRKRVKYHWYHLRLLREIWPVQMKGLAAEASRLADLLGDDHDLAVLRMALAHDGDTLGEPEQIAALSGLAQRRQDRLRAEARTLGLRLFAEKPVDFGARMRTCWQAAQCDALRGGAPAGGYGEGVC